MSTPSAVELLKEADDELMKAQAILVTCGRAVVNAEGAPDPHSLASVIETTVGIIAEAVSKVEDVRAMCEGRPL